MSKDQIKSAPYTYLLALGLGAIYCLGFAPLNWWPLTVVGIAGLYFLLEEHDTVSPSLLTWVFGIGKYGVGASWVYVSINVYGGAHPVLATVLVILFVCFAAWLFCWPLGWLYHRVRSKGAWVRIFVFAACWAVMDWLLTWFLTGFPWLYAANGMLDTVFAAWIPVFGIIGASALVVLSAAGLTLIAKPEWRRMGLLVVVTPWLLAVPLSLVEWVDVGETKRVALVQGNLDQAIKWQRDQAQPNYDKHFSLSQDVWHIADLVIWPEAAITAYPQMAMPWLEELTEIALSTETSLITGIPGVTAVGDEYDFYNLALGLGQAQGRFAKHHLVPFGEYVPLEGLLRGLIGFFDLPMSSMSAGPAQQNNIRTPFGEVAMAICYEVAYPDSMRRSAQSAALLATITNDTWFGASLGPHQHMEIARARALENGRFLVRASNNGITGVVNHRGKVVGQLPQFEAGVLQSKVNLTSGRTPYGHWGHIPVFAFIALVIGLSLWRR